MQRCGRIRKFIEDYNQSPRTNKLSFFIPFLILALELIVLIDALITLNALIISNLIIVSITIILVTISVLEIILVTREIHNKFLEDNFDKILTIKLNDFITKKREKNVKIIISDFLEQYPEYDKHRNKIYHTTCQILETHQKETLDKDIRDKLKLLIKNNKKANVDEIVEKFTEKYPRYEKYRSEIYEKTCKLLEPTE
jgi:hypothetical protein